jgi:L,D-transpeptidase catalytic domain/Putative peptidoglycan binding domain
MRSGLMSLSNAARLVACATLLALAACAPNNSSAKAAATPEVPVAGVDVVTDPSVEATAPTTVAETTTTLPKTTLSRTLERGLAAADDVRVVQQRLNDLHFDVGVADGIYGANTEMAVWAYQSLIMNLSGKDVTGKVSPELWTRMQDPLGLPVFRPDASPTHAEVFLATQTMVLYVDRELKLITHVSSGSGQKWCDELKNVPAWPGATTTTLPPGQKNPRFCGTSLTPGGVFKVYLKRSNWVDIPLGRVYNPISFNAGIAIHGYPEVPKGPASHGCVRVPMHIAQYLPDLLHTSDQIFVFDGVKQPEVYGDQKPPADERDPTDTTVVTTTTTTVKPTTTVAGATTTKPGGPTTTLPTATVPTATTVKPVPVPTTSAPVTVSPTTGAPPTPAPTTTPPTSAKSAPVTSAANPQTPASP